MCKALLLIVYSHHNQCQIYTSVKLTKGDEVYTKAGLLGTIVGMTEKIVTLEVASGVKLKVVRSQVAGKSNGLFETENK